MVQRGLMCRVYGDGHKIWSSIWRIEERLDDGERAEVPMKYQSPSWSPRPERVEISYSAFYDDRLRRSGRRHGLVDL